MSDKRKILIIENQYIQFLKIYENLRSDIFMIYPNINENEYISFIDNVRVWVNEFYKKEQRIKALNFIETLINDKNIELILMDHILGGAHHCKTGIDLAYALNETRKKSNKIIPILFLSKTKFDDRKRYKGVKFYKTKLKGINDYEKDFGTSGYSGDTSNYIWVHKGYFGDEILEPTYFEENVMTKIEGLLGSSEKARFWNALEIVLKIKFPKNQMFKKTMLENIRKSYTYENINQDLINNIISVSVSKKINDLQIDENIL